LGIKLFTPERGPRPWIIGPLAKHAAGEALHSFQWIPPGTHQIHAIFIADDDKPSFVPVQVVTVRPGETVRINLTIPDAPTVPAPR
jgi:hypothetical protein